MNTQQITFFKLSAAIFSGFILYTLANSIYQRVDLYHLSHEIHNNYIQATSAHIQALLSDITDQPFPNCYESDNTLAADIADAYIEIGNTLYDFDTAVQRFVLAHEMHHIHEKHHTRGIAMHNTYLPIFIGMILFILLGICYFVMYDQCVSIWNGCHTYATCIATRTCGLHTHAIQQGVYHIIITVPRILLVICIAMICANIHIYLGNGVDQYMEYRCDIGAVATTHDADAPCNLFTDDDRNPDSHPSDPARRYYIRAVEANRFAIPDIHDLPHLLTPQQIIGAILYHIITYIPLSPLDLSGSVTFY